MSLKKYLKQVVTLSPRATVEEAARAMRDHEIGAIVVTSDDGAPLGIVTDRDLALRAVADGWSVRTPIEEVMTRGLATLDENDTLEQATRLMAERGVRRLPIVDAGRVVGLLSLDDVVLLLGMELGNVASAIFSGMARRAATPTVEGAR